MINVVSDPKELAQQFRETARTLRRSANGHWPFHRDHKLIEAETWENAASIIETTIIMQPREQQ